MDAGDCAPDASVQPRLLSAPLGDVEVADIWSDAVGDTFRLFVGRCGPRPQATVVVTDGNGLFGLTLDTVRLMQVPGLVPDLTVVGIGYRDTTVADTRRVRARDLTPTARPDLEPRSGLNADFTSGGGEAFLREDVLSRVAQPGHGPAPSISFGHSLGGLLGVQALLSEPETFDHHVISSPSLWWDRDWLAAAEQACAQRGGPRGKVYFGIGADETDPGRRREAAALPDGHWAKPPPEPLDMVEDLLLFVDVLRSRDYPALDLACDVLPGEYHATVPAPVLTRGLRHIFEHV